MEPSPVAPVAQTGLTPTLIGALVNGESLPTIGETVSANGELPIPPTIERLTSEVPLVIQALNDPWMFAPDFW